MTKLADIEVDTSAAAFNPTVIAQLKSLLSVSGDDMITSSREESETPKTVAYTGPSIVNLLSLVLIITVVTSGSTMFLVNNLVDNPYLLNGIHAVLIVLLYWIFGKLHT